MKLKLIQGVIMKNNNEFMRGFEGFILGGIAGGVIALLLAPQSGEETRHDINKYMRFARMKRHKLVADARIKSRELVKKAADIRSRSKEFAAGKYTGSVESLEKEIKSLKAGLDKAVKTYRNFTSKEGSADKMVEEIFVDFDRNDIETDETSPKHEGMSRRH
jgi:gas vesicle protein